MARPRAASGGKPEKSEVTKDSILAELEAMDGVNNAQSDSEEESTYFVDVWGHRLESEPFVRAFAWARKRGNELKACLIYADAHELDFEESDAPVVKRD